MPLGGEGVGEDGDAGHGKDVDVGDEEEVVGGNQRIAGGHDALQHKLEHDERQEHGGHDVHAALDLGDGQDEDDEGEDDDERDGHDDHQRVEAPARVMHSSLWFWYLTLGLQLGLLLCIIMAR